MINEIIIDDKLLDLPRYPTIHYRLSHDLMSSHGDNQDLRLSPFGTHGKPEASTLELELTIFGF